MLFFAPLMTLLAARYLPANPDGYFTEQRVVYEDNTFLILGHVFGVGRHVRGYDQLPPPAPVNLAPEARRSP